jgi:hypothetical protein
MCEIHLGGECAEFLHIILREVDSWDEKWLQVEVRVVVGGFRASVAGEICSDDLARFEQQLSHLHDSLSGTAELTTVEDWFLVKACGDGRGHISFDCLLMDQVGIGNTLTFRLSLDQTFTRATLADIRRALKEFPSTPSPSH